MSAADDPSLGAPVEYIDLRGTTREKPATCKYTGNKYYSLDWKTPGVAALHDWCLRTIGCLTDETSEREKFHVHHR